MNTQAIGIIAVIAGSFSIAMFKGMVTSKNHSADYAVCFSVAGAIAIAFAFIFACRG